MPVAFAERLSARFWPLPTDADSDPAKTLVELRKWFELRGIEAKDPAAVSLLRRFGALVAYLDHPPTNGLRRVRLESSDSRWVTVPLTDGRGHIDWPLPDRKGRRLRPPAARLVSRYEPLVRWAERHYRPVEWTPADTEPDLVVRRIVTNDDRGAGLDLPEWLPVAVHPHPDELRFSVTLPSAAARSMANAISAVRTGYAGYTLAFRYRLRDHDTPGERGWQKLLEAMQFTADTLPDPPSVVEPTPGRAGREPRLFRHERLVSLDRWPFIHECWLVARSQYDVRRLDTIGAGHTKPTFGEPARREPGFLAVRRPLVVADGTATWKVTFYLTRTGDLLTPLELAASPPLLPKSAAVPGAGHTVDFPPDGLPEPSSGYHLYYRVPSPSGDVYLAVAELLMPWHTRYAVPEGDLRPWCRPLDSRVSIDEERPKVVCGSSTGSSTFTPAYTVTVRLTIRRGAGDQELLFADADRRVVTVTRNGRCSSAILTT